MKVLADIKQKNYFNISLELYNDNSTIDKEWKYSNGWKIILLYKITHQTFTNFEGLHLTQFK